MDLAFSEMGQFSTQWLMPQKNKNVHIWHICSIRKVALLPHAAQPPTYPIPKMEFRNQAIKFLQTGKSGTCILKINWWQENEGFKWVVENVCEKTLYNTELLN